MSNVHGLFSNKDNDDDDNNDDENNRFVGGIGDRGGGSGLAVQPNVDDSDRDRVFGLAENASADDNSQVRRTITMYRDGFVVDDGPYRRLDDPANAEFLRSLATGRTPRELLEASGGEGNVVVGLVDKRQEEYVETFRSFSGQGTSLGTAASASTTDAAAAAAAAGVFSTTSLGELAAAPPPVDESQPTTNVAVRLLNGQRQIVRINLSSTVQDLALHLREHAPTDGQPFRLAAGFPPQPLTDVTATIEAAGLKGAQVSMQKL
ncbi:hypothetical protein ACA910_000627 [Epithemia clementina (nom. ined.)]